MSRTGISRESWVRGARIAGPRDRARNIRGDTGKALRTFHLIRVCARDEPRAGFLVGTAAGWPTFIHAANHGSLDAQATF